MVRLLRSRRGDLALAQLTQRDSPVSLRFADSESDCDVHFFRHPVPRYWLYESRLDDSPLPFVAQPVG